MIIPASGTITGTPNGYCRSGGSHKGFDIANSSGTPIVAAAAGTVTQSHYSDSAGHMVWINHGGGWVTKYFHLREPSPLETGAKVKRGDRVGPMGTTGNSTGVHLHFQIERNGVVVKDAELINDFKCGATVTRGAAIRYPFIGLPGPPPPAPPAPPAPPSPYPLLRSGSAGEAVTRVQKLLNAAGFSVGAVDGQFGPKTKEAVEKFQRSVGTSVDGIVGPKTWGALLTRPAAGTLLRSGSAGEEVKHLQKALNATISAGLVEDGKFGPNTATAVKKYQGSRGLSADGIVGPKTWAALKGGR